MQRFAKNNNVVRLYYFVPLSALHLGRSGIHKESVYNIGTCYCYVGVLNLEYKHFVQSIFAFTLHGHPGTSQDFIISSIV